ncbi:hypothetical protein [Dipodfec virus RodF1_43]|uniref:Uncharacterized protein n=1 Tax=Dipodfec virus RodF1_43 TaxID=2929297 RepID=A0A976R8Y0_9VIRU|nr:hypothetical protein [Dipodfec virus RodF1_43]
MQWFIENWTFVLSVLLFLVHFVYAIVSSFRNGKKIDRLCDKCHLPVVEDTPHKCLSEQQLQLLEKFINSILNNNNDGGTSNG